MSSDSYWNSIVSVQWAACEPAAVVNGGKWAPQPAEAQRGVSFGLQPGSLTRDGFGLLTRWRYRLVSFRAPVKNGSCSCQCFGGGSEVKSVDSVRKVD